MDPLIDLWPLHGSQVLQNPHTSVTPTNPRLTESLTGVSKEHRALFNHSGGWGWIVHEGGSPPFVGCNLEENECSGTETGSKKKEPISHVTAAPVRLDTKCKAASRQFWVCSNGCWRGRWWWWGIDMVLPAMSAESLKLYHFRKVSGGHCLHFPLSSFSSSPTTSSTLNHPTSKPTHLRDWGCYSIKAHFHLPCFSSSLPLRCYSVITLYREGKLGLDKTVFLPVLLYSLQAGD